MKQNPWLSLGLLFLAFSLFGWLLSDSIPNITEWLSQRTTVLAIEIDESLISLLTYLVAGTFILLIVVAMTAPISLMDFFVEGSLTSGRNAFISGIFWTFIAVLMVLCIEYFIRLLIMIGVIILARIDLRNAGFSRLQSFFIILGIGILGLLSGYLIFNRWG